MWAPDVLRQRFSEGIMAFPATAFLPDGALDAARLPVVGGAAYGTAMACEMAKVVERAGGDAVLLLPPYLVRCEQEGLLRHIRAVCASVSIAVIPYSRDNAIIAADTLLRLAETCPNLIALKDGTGN